MTIDPESRLLSRDDWEVLRDVRLRSLAESPDAFGSTLDRETVFDEKEWRRRLVGPVAVVLVEGRPVAVGGTFAHDGVLQVWGMWTDPDHRRRGYARKVLDLLLGDLAPQERAEQRVQLHVNLTAHAARTTYERYGFVGTGHFEELRPGSDEQMELMVLDSSGG
jgi:ribosomal protein S18 acetylase RimI-like enzyme